MDILFLKLIIIIFLLSTIQSIVGVGLLIIGTPILLAYNFDFFIILQILLPCSLMVNFYHLFFKNKKRVSISFKKIFLIYCLPFVPLGLILIYSLKDLINFKILIGFLILIILFFKKIYKVRKISKIKKRFILVFIGLFHGLTNLGGTLLSLFLLINNNNNNNNNNNIKIKKEIDFGYLCLAGIQYLFLIFYLNGEFEIKNIILIMTSFVSCLIGNKINKYINQNKYSGLLNAMIFISAIIAIASNFK
jgi:uncharacterized membrane protein YfcA